MPSLQSSVAAFVLSGVDFGLGEQMVLPIVYGRQHARVPPQQFPIVYDEVPALVRRLLRIRADTATAIVGDGVLELRFGRHHLVTPLTNVAAVEALRSGVGASRIGIRVSRHGEGLTFGTERVPPGPSGTIRVRFHRRVSAVAPTVVMRCGWVAVTTAAPEGLATALSSGLSAAGRTARPSTNTSAPSANQE